MPFYTKCMSDPYPFLHIFRFEDSNPYQNYVNLKLWFWDFLFSNNWICFGHGFQKSLFELTILFHNFLNMINFIFS